MRLSPGAGEIIVNGAGAACAERSGRRPPGEADLSGCPAGIDDGTVAIVGLGAWCDFVTEDEYRQRLVRDGWPPDEVENLVEEFQAGGLL
jgi:hypothetical protein